MRVGLAKESDQGERRVLLQPAEIYEIAKLADVVVEHDAGVGEGYADSDYSAIGARIGTKTEVWNSDIVLKFKAPSVGELMMMRPGGKIAALFHAERNQDQLKILLERRCKAYSFEFFRETSGHFPLMAATGEMSGRIAVIYAAYHLQSHLGGSGRLLAKTSHAEPANVLVLGYGNVGRAAAETARALGAKVRLVRWSLPPASSGTLDGFEYVGWDTAAVGRILPECDVVIGALRISTFDTPAFLTRDFILSMRKGSIVVDVTAGYGSGYIQTSDATTTLDSPVTIGDGVLHIKIRNFPKGYHMSAGEQISRIYGPYVKRLIESLKSGDLFSVAEAGVITDNGRITNANIAHHFGRSIA